MACRQPIFHSYISDATDLVSHIIQKKYATMQCLRSETRYLGVALYALFEWMGILNAFVHKDRNSTQPQPAGKLWTVWTLPHCALLYTPNLTPEFFLLCSKLRYSAISFVRCWKFCFDFGISQLFVILFSINFQHKDGQSISLDVIWDSKLVV